MPALILTKAFSLTELRLGVQPAICAMIRAKPENLAVAESEEEDWI